MLLLLLSSVKNEREREKKKRKHDIVGHIRFVCDWMNFIAAFFHTVGGAAAAVSIEQQFVIEKSTFRSHFASKTKYIMELNVERINDDNDNDDDDGDWCACLPQWRGQTTHWQRGRWFDLSQ